MSTIDSAASTFDLEDLLHLEQKFFDGGYIDGYDHGRTHGLIEGRALGRKKGYELWEEIGFYEGFAKIWEVVCQRNEKEPVAASRTASHIRHLLDLISQFPKVNPSADTQNQDSELDVTALLSKIRARYKALCSTLGVKPRLLAAGPSAAVVEGVAEIPEAPARKKVWKLSGGPPQGTPNDISF